MLRSLIGDVNRKIILVFLLSNVLSMVAIFIIPARAYQQNIEFLLILNFSFIFCICFVSILTYKLVRLNLILKPRRHNVQYVMKDKILMTNVKVLIYAPILGFILLLIDRLVFSKNINSKNLKC